MAMLPADNIGINKGLQIVVCMFMDILGLEDGIDICQWLQAMTAGFVVYHSDTFIRCTYINKVKSIDTSANDDVVVL